MNRFLMGLMLGLCCFLQDAIAKESSLSSIYLGSRECDPASFVENVNVIHGDYSEIEVDLKVTAPDSLILSRFYSSRDTSQTAVLGGWRFNPHCFLSVQKDSKGRIQTPAEGELEYFSVCVGNPEGSILTYEGWLNAKNPKRTLLKIETSGEVIGIANTAKGNISSWTNLKNNELYFDSQNDSFELMLCSEGKRYYTKHSTKDIYLLRSEILPSGNKIFYEYDENGQVTFIKEANASEKKILAWIRIQYDKGIHIDASNGKTVDYHFDQDISGYNLLTQVDRSDKPTLLYEYQVTGGHALIVRKSLPEGRFVQVDYHKQKDNKYKVRSIICPFGLDETSNIQFSYEDGCTEAYGPGDRKTFYRFDNNFQLTAIEQYLDGSLYRVHKKTWGKQINAGNLTSTSVEDGGGNVFYYKLFTYDDKGKGNIVEEREYGDLTGINPGVLPIDANGVLNQGECLKTYSYFSENNANGFFLGDPNGTGVKYWYKKGTNLLIKKMLLTGAKNQNYSAKIRKRYFYDYNEDAVLIRTVVDDGYEEKSKHADGISQRLITSISPKQELPNVGAPETVEQKYTDQSGNTEFLLKRIVNQFDSQGQIVSQAIHDANGDYRYSIRKGYQNGLLVLETDPLGNKTHFSYDANHNLVSEYCSNSGLSISYGYDLRNRLIYQSEKDSTGNSHETHISYDAAGNKISEIDRFGNETLYVNDSLGRPIAITFPEMSNGLHSSIKPTYTFNYDLFDNQTTVTNSKGQVISKSSTVHGKPTAIQYFDGTQELFKYDSGGNLYKYYGRDGLLQSYKYDEIGHLISIKDYERGGQDSKQQFKTKSYEYNAFHKISEWDEKDEDTIYSYDKAGRLAALKKGKRKVEFIYDALGRTCGVKKWKSSKTFTLEAKEYDLLDRVIEERTEDTHGHVHLKSKYIYNAAGQIAQIIGYPQNKESMLMQYEYDDFARPRKIINAAHEATEIFYDDAYVNEWGQKAHKRILVDPMGNRTEEIFDAQDNLLKVTKKDTAGQVLIETELSYDSDGNKVLEKALVLADGKPSKSFDKAWSFDEKGHLQSVAYGKSGSEEQTWRFKYNSYGSLEAKHNPGSKEPIIYQYDKYGNLGRVSCKDPKKAVDYQLFYDKRNNLKDINVASSHMIEFIFDEHDMPISETIDDEFGSYQVSRIYDGEGKIRTLQLPNGSYIEYTYEGPFVKQAIRFNRQKKELYRYEVISRDLMGNILEEVLPGSAVRKQQWDEAGRRIEIGTDFFEDRVLAGGYDPLNNLKKRQTVFKDKKYNRNYEYNALSQLILEKGGKGHKYAYDSIGNRLQKDSYLYNVNELNQHVDAAGATYTYDPNGSLATKTVGDKTWVYQSNALNQLVSIKNNDQIVKFTYDHNGRRLTKSIESESGKTTTFRYFYLGSTEIGCIDEKGAIIELKIPSDPNRPEFSPIAIEIIKEVYTPISDLQGNIVCLLDQTKNIVETYQYSVFGEEKIINAQGKTILDSSVGNPWRYLGKRVDKEVELIYFGYRYYDPKIGRWISPDPLGDIDGPNLYAYSRNNPMKYIDYFGLTSSISENCGCIYHNHPGWSNAGPDCVCICASAGAGISSIKIGSNVTSAFKGISHGVVDFAIGSIHDLHTALAYMGTEQQEMASQERVEMIEAIEQSQEARMNAVGGWMMDRLSADPSDAMYQAFRSKTTTGLEIGSLVAGGYGAVKGVMAFNKLAKIPMQASRLVKNVAKSNKIWTSTKKRTSVQNAFSHWKDHGSEFPELFNSKQYVEKTHNFFTARDKLLTKIRPNGEIIVYDAETNVFGVFTNEGIPKTMFKPIDGFSYYERN